MFLLESLSCIVSKTNYHLHCEISYLLKTEHVCDLNLVVQVSVQLLFSELSPECSVVLLQANKGMRAPI